MFLLDNKPNTLYTAMELGSHSWTYFTGITRKLKGACMSEDREFRERRNFLVKCSCFLLGSLTGLGHISEVLAFEEKNELCPPSPRLALIIDDIGHSFSRARRFLDLNVPLTFSILPRLSRSVRLAEEIHALHHEIMLHQPMEPYSPTIDPGPGALYVGHPREELIGIVRQNLQDIPYVIGVNNHMGSKFTEHQMEMSQVLKTIKHQGLFFIDSLTSSHSIGCKLAQHLHIPASSRNVFIDNHRDECSILFQLHHLEKIAWKYGQAIGIGHPYPQTARAIRQYLRCHKDETISLVPISRIIEV